MIVDRGNHFIVPVYNSIIFTSVQIRRKRYYSRRHLVVFYPLFSFPTDPPRTAGKRNKTLCRQNVPSILLLTRLCHNRLEVGRLCPKRPLDAISYTLRAHASGLPLSHSIAFATTSSPTYYVSVMIL